MCDVHNRQCEMCNIHCKMCTICNVPLPQERLQELLAEENYPQVEIMITVLYSVQSTV